MSPSSGGGRVVSNCRKVLASLIGSTWLSPGPSFCTYVKVLVQSGSPRSQQGASGKGSQPRRYRRVHMRPGRNDLPTGESRRIKSVIGMEDQADIQIMGNLFIRRGSGKLPEKIGRMRKTVVRRQRLLSAPDPVPCGNHRWRAKNTQEFPFLRDRDDVQSK